MIKVIVFDYDGVIVDSFPTVFAVYKKMCRAVGVKPPATIQKFRKLYGYNYKATYRNLRFKLGDYPKVDAVFRKETVEQRPKLFRGIPKVLEQLSRRYVLILATSNLKREALQKLKRFKLARYFSYVLGAGKDDSFTKNNAVIDLLKSLKVKKNEAVAIGDRNIDYDRMREVGIRNVLLVEYGWGYDKAKIKKQRVLIRKPTDIINAISYYD